VQERLIVFTRYPEPGKAKTRLIPALGGVGAAELHRQMAEHTLMQVRGLQAIRNLSIEVRFAGGNFTQMQGWLGADLNYRTQGEGDLGDRMFHACQAAFNDGNDATIIIGTDCPELDTGLLQKAFQELQQHDLVLGPATDGGYYLVGLRRPVPQLFVGIAWSTSEVLQQTVAIAERLGLAIAYLPPFSDVDQPQDLEIWQRVREHGAAKVGSQKWEIAAGEPITIVIPVLNEAKNLSRTLAAVQAETPTEIIVVDGGSQDKTVEVARALGVSVITAPAGRARQMNAGARVASGDILLFLHGDTLLPKQFDRLIRQCLSQPGVVAGAFELKINGAGWGLRLLEWGIKGRSHLLQMPYGDQAIFLKASVFQEIGGFPDLPIMEDFELVSRLKRLGKVAIAPAPVLTSGRRWQKLGVWQTTVTNQLIILAYTLGVSPATIAQWYRRGDEG
jgi:hypothetical protein